MVTKPGHSSSLFSIPSLDLWQVERCLKPWNVGMDPVMNLRRALEADLRLCNFCQKSNKPKHDVREGTSYSKNVSEATTKRKKVQGRSKQRGCRSSG